MLHVSAYFAPIRITFIPASLCKTYGVESVQSQYKIRTDVTVLKFAIELKQKKVTNTRQTHHSIVRLQVIQLKSLTK